MSEDYVTLRISRKDYETMMDACACERARRTQELEHWLGREALPRVQNMMTERDELSACIQRLKAADHDHPVPRCSRCGCMSTAHAVDDEELRGCLDCECDQFEFDAHAKHDFRGECCEYHRRIYLRARANGMPESGRKA